MQCFFVVHVVCFCVLLVNENIRCSKTSERNGYLGKNEGEIKKKEKKRRKRKKKDPVPSRQNGMASEVPLCFKNW